MKVELPRWLCLLALASAFAWGATPRGLARDADRLYKEGKYREAAEVLRRAHAAEPNPLYLYNIARALDQAGDVSASLEAYRQYVSLSADQTQPELVKRANLAMDRLRTMAAKAEAERQVQEAERRRLENERLQAEAQANAERQRALDQQRAFEAKERAALEAKASHVDSRRVATYVLGGTAIAGFGAALGFGLWANSSKTAFHQATTLAEKAAFERDTKTQALVTDVALAVGLAATAAALIVFPGFEPAAAPLTLGVGPLEGGGIATVGGNF